MFDAFLALLGIASIAFLSVPGSFLIGGLAGAGIFYLDLTQDDKEPGFFARLFKSLFMVSLLPGLAWITSFLVMIKLAGFGESYFPRLLMFSGYMLTAAVSMFGAFFLLRFVPQLLNNLKAKVTKKTDLERNKKTDVREIHKILPQALGSFDPVKFFPGQDKDQMFAGLDENKKPVFLDYNVWKISHTLLTGRTRSGKGVAAQILLSQAIARGEFVVVLDPKVDNWMPHIFKAQCEKAGLPWHFVDLRQTAGPQINIFQGCDVETLENMLIGGFSLSEKGDNADFYRLGDRKAARRAAAWLAQHDGATARDCIEAIGESWINSPVKSDQAASFHSYMLEMAELPSVNRPAGTGGLDIAEGVKTGGCLYVVGDMINPRILRMQRMILLRLLFLAKSRDQINQGRTITVFADEFKVHISRPFITSLGASAGWGLHTILAFQSLQDLADCPADLDKDAVRGSVMENCGIQLSYAIKDPETAEWLAASTGTILVDDESRTVDKNFAQAEIVAGRRSIRQAERYFIDTNMLQNMPKGCGVLAIAGQLPAFCYTSPVSVERSHDSTTPTAPAMPASATASASTSSPATAAAAGIAASALDIEEIPPAAAPGSDEAESIEIPDPEDYPAEGGGDDVEEYSERYAVTDSEEPTPTVSAADLLDV